MPDIMNSLLDELCMLDADNINMITHSLLLDLISIIGSRQFLAQIARIAGINTTKKAVVA